MNFENFGGNEKLKTALDNIEKHNRMPHAVIINGGSSEDRNALAMHLSSWAVCSGENKPCHQCKNCHNAERKNHSDIYYAKPDGKTQIYVKKELEHIIKDCYIKPNDAQKKVYIFEECDKRFSSLCQNMFLKTLEEPPQDVLFILECENSNTLLNTILSRATVFSLESKSSIPEETLQLAIEIAQAIVHPKEYELMKSLYKLSTREVFNDTLNAVILLLRDGLAYSLGNDAVTDEETAQKLCKRLTKSQYLNLIETTNDALIKAGGNISLKLLSTRLCAEYRRLSWQR